jgi:hypothetical protein
MSISLQKILKENGLGVIVIILLIAFGVYTLSTYLTGKGSFGMERMDSTPNQAYNNTPNGSGPSPSGGMVHGARENIGQNEVFSSVNGLQTSMPQTQDSSMQAGIQNPSELLPLDNNGEWSKLTPDGAGIYANINTLKAGYNIGIDTIGSSRRNMNLQIRSEQPNPQVYVGPWNMSTIQPDFMRPPLEIGQGGQ